MLQVALAIVTAGALTKLAVKEAASSASRCESAGANCCDKHGTCSLVSGSGCCLSNVPGEPSLTNLSGAATAAGLSKTCCLAETEYYNNSKLVTMNTSAVANDGNCCLAHGIDALITSCALPGAPSPCVLGDCCVGVDGASGIITNGMPFDGSCCRAVTTYTDAYPYILMGIAAWTTTLTAHWTGRARAV